MLQKKICMFGSPHGTRLIRQRMSSIFSEAYHQTIGVMIHRKEVRVSDVVVNLLVWDLDIADDFHRVRASYLRGMSGYILVEDPQDTASMRQSRGFRQLARDVVGLVPAVTVSVDLGANRTETTSNQRLIEDTFFDLASRLLRSDHPDSRSH